MSSQQGTTRPRPDTQLAIISLGANLDSFAGPPATTLRSVIEQLRGWSAGHFAASSLYLSSPVDCAEDTADFVNAAVSLELPGGTAAEQLLGRLQDLEQAFGRERSTSANESRPLDLDLIAFGDQQINSEYLTLPHPRFHQRRFVLAPLVELDPGLVIAPYQQSVSQILQALPDQPRCERMEST